MAPPCSNTSVCTGTCSYLKGVVLSHRNLVAALKCLMFIIFPRDDVYIAFLPLAHVMELLAENVMMLFGIRVGYSSPGTMTDTSPRVMKGCRGDAAVLRGAIQRH